MHLCYLSVLLEIVAISAALSKFAGLTFWLLKIVDKHHVWTQQTQGLSALDRVSTKTTQKISCNKLILMF